MSKKQFLEAGVIASTHGVRGGMLIKPWSDEPGFLCGFSRVYVDGEEKKLLSASVHKSMLLCTLEGISDMDAAIRMKGKVVYINREDIELEEGRYFVQDLIGAEVYDSERGLLGKVEEVLNLPANDVYVVRGGKNYMIPAVEEFIKRVDVDGERIDVEIIEGMEYEG